MEEPRAALDVDKSPLAYRRRRPCRVDKTYNWHPIDFGTRAVCIILKAVVLINLPVLIQVIKYKYLNIFLFLFFSLGYFVC